MPRRTQDGTVGWAACRRLPGCHHDGRGGLATAPTALSAADHEQERSPLCNEDVGVRLKATACCTSRHARFRHLGHDWATDGGPFPNTLIYQYDTPLSRLPNKSRSGMLLSKPGPCSSRHHRRSHRSAGSPGEATKATIDRYNSFCETGVDEDFHKRAEHLVRIGDAPFYGSTLEAWDAHDVRRPAHEYQHAGVRRNDQRFRGSTMSGHGRRLFWHDVQLPVEGNNLGANCLTFGYLTGRISRTAPWSRGEYPEELLRSTPL